MKKTTWLLGVVTLGLTFAAPAFSTPIPTCGAALLSTYDATGYECTLGIYTLDDFTFSATGTAPLVADTDITVDPTGSTPTTISVQFSTPGGFTAGEDQTAEYIVQYNIDPLLPMISGGLIDLGPNDPVTLTGEFCGNGTIISAPNTNPSTFPTCMGTDPNGIFPRKLQLTGTGDSSSPNTFEFPAMTVTTLDTRLILDVSNGGTDSFGSVADVVGGPTAAPEPSAAFLIAPALLGLAWFRKKARAS